MPVSDVVISRGGENTLSSYFPFVAPRQPSRSHWLLVLLWPMAQAVAATEPMDAVPAAVLTPPQAGASEGGRADQADWLDGRTVRDLLERETQQAWRAEAVQPDIPRSVAPRPVAPSTLSLPPSLDHAPETAPQVRAIYGTGRYRVAEIDIAGVRHLFASDPAGRLRSQAAGGYRLVSIEGRCVSMRKGPENLSVCWQPEGER